jgi:uncharacterized membrane protein YidH (DUF202 family)
MTIMVIGFLFLVAGYAFHASDSITASFCTSPGWCGNVATVRQVIGTLSIIVGIVIQAIGFLKYTRTRFSSPMKT